MNSRSVKSPFPSGIQIVSPRFIDHPNYLPTTRMSRHVRRALSSAPPPLAQRESGRTFRIFHSSVFLDHSNVRTSPVPLIKYVGEGSSINPDEDGSEELEVGG